MENDAFVTPENIEDDVRVSYVHYLADKYNAAGLRAFLQTFVKALQIQSGQ